MFEEAFGTSDLDLYTDVLHVSKDCTPAQLRKGYYKQALKFHPDKNKSNEAKLKFQAISWAYSVGCFLAFNVQIVQFSIQLDFHPYRFVSIVSSLLWWLCDLFL